MHDSLLCSLIIDVIGDITEQLRAGSLAVPTQTSIAACFFSEQTITPKEYFLSLLWSLLW
jgi:hypothetical protein